MACYGCKRGLIEAYCRCNHQILVLSQHWKSVDEELKDYGEKSWRRGLPVKQIRAYSQKRDAFLRALEEKLHLVGPDLLEKHEGLSLKGWARTNQ